MSTSIRFELLLVVAACSTACGSKEMPAAESPANPVAKSSQAPDDPNRPLTASECQSLAETIVEACNDRGNDRSTGVDGWCSDMIQRTAGDAPWVTGDCTVHMKYMDAFCFRGAGNVHGMIDCDRNVDRSR